MMTNRTDAIILAGTKGCTPLEINGVREYKQFMKLGKKRLIEYSIEAALGCPEIDRVYVVSDVVRLEKLLAPELFGHTKLNITHDRGSYIRNVRQVFLEEVLQNAGHGEYDPAAEKEHADAFRPNTYRRRYLERNPDAEQHRIVVLYSDVPFIIPEDISRFLATSPDADLVIGFADAPAVEQLEADTGYRLSDPVLKTQLFPIEDTDARFNNLASVKPLRIPVQVWDLVQRLYDQRYLLDEEGGKNERNWQGIVRAGWEYTKSFESRSTVLWGFLKSAVHFRALKAALKRGAVLPRLLLDRTDFQRSVHLLSNRQIDVQINLCDVVHPMIDVDNEVMYNLLRTDDEELFKNIYYTGRRYGNGDYSGAPEQALELIMRDPGLSRILFGGEPEKIVSRKVFDSAFDRALGNLNKEKTPEQTSWTGKAREWESSEGRFSR